MIRILVMANESLLADYIASTLSQEIDLDVIRVTRDELGLRKDYSVVIVVDDGLVENESIKLQEVIRDDIALLLVRVSLKNRIVYIDESYQLINPGMAQVVDLVRDFNTKNLKKKPEEGTDSQKKMNRAGLQTGIYNRQNAYFPIEKPVVLAQVVELEYQLPIRANRTSLSNEVLSLFISFFLHQLRRKDPRDVTLSNQQGYLIGNKKW